MTTESLDSIDTCFIKYVVQQADQPMTSAIASKQSRIHLIKWFSGHLAQKGDHFISSHYPADRLDATHQESVDTIQTSHS